MNRTTLLIVFLIAFGFNASSQIEFNCDDNQTAVLIQLDANLEADDIEWGLNLGDTLIADGYTGATESHELCLNDGCYELSLYNTTGTEWSGVVSVILADEVIASADLDSDPIVLHFGVNSEGCGEGCTDPNALNYDEDASIDDGSCILSGDCDGSWVNMEIDTEWDASDISWAIFQGETEIATGSGYGNYESSSEWICLADGCYHVRLFDSSSDGWSGSEFELELGEQTLTEGYLPDGQYGEFYFSVGEVECSGEDLIPGCTDPAATNYDPIANQDLGNCEYEECDGVEVTVDIDSPLGEGEIEWSVENNTFNFNIAEGIANGDDSFNVCVPDSGCFEIEFENISAGAWSGTYSISAYGAEIASGEFDDELEESMNFSFVVDGCGEGCTDPTAVNYDDDATIDDDSCLYPEDCTGNWVKLEVETDWTGGEISWNIVQDGVEIVGNDNYENSEEHTEWICLEDGCYTFELFDSGSNGWSGSEFELELGDETILEGYLPNGDFGEMDFAINNESCSDEVSLPGCTDPEALNYSEIATEDDGSCEYPECQLNEVTIHMDATVGPDDIEWAVMGGDTLFGDGYTGGTDAIDLCLSDGCYVLELYDLTSNWSGLASIAMGNDTLVFQDLSDTDDSYIIEFGINNENCGEILGCTDPEALNYNAEATVDDGSCIYPPECFIDFELTASEDFPNTIWVIPNDSIEDAESIEWDFGDGSVSGEIYPDYEYDGDGPYTLCLTVVFEDEDEEECEATFCMEISADMIPDLIPGFAGSTGFSINVIDDASTIGVGELDNELSFDFYPNPAGDQLNVDVFNSTSPEAELLVRDLNGRIVKSVVLDLAGSKAENSIDVSEISSGVYIITLKTEQSNINRRMIKK